MAISNSKHIQHEEWSVRQARIEQGNYRIGDVVNGHVLTKKGAWKPTKRSELVTGRLPLGVYLYFGAILAVIAVVIFIVIRVIGAYVGEVNEPNMFDRWQSHWNNSMTAEDRATICASWDLTPSSTAIQFEEATGIPADVAKMMLGQVC